MIYTDKGTFETFAHLRHAYLTAHGGYPKEVVQYFREDEWDDNALHISELGKCARAQMYRLLGTEKKWETPEKQANDELMFWQGNMIHALTAAACDWAGILASYESNLELPDGWSGHYDIIWQGKDDVPEIGWDGKTVRSNNFNYWYEWPKDKDAAQAKGYLCFLPGVDHWQVEYIDRGGSNTPWLFDIERNDDWVELRMAHLDHLRGLLPELPDPLRPQYKASYRKDSGLPTYSLNKVWLANSWECEWCPYHWASNSGTQANPSWTVNEDSPCKPEMKKLEVGSKLKGRLQIDDAHREQIVGWLQQQIQVHVDPRADVTVVE